MIDPLSVTPAGHSTRGFHGFCTAPIMTMAEMARKSQKDSLRYDLGAIVATSSSASRTASADSVSSVKW